MNKIILTIILLICSNTFMTFAWYAHLKNLASKPILMVIVISWMIAFFEYMFQVPANRIGFEQAHLTLGQLKIMQEVITLAVFAVFSVLYLNEPLTLRQLGGFALIAAGAALVFYKG